MEYPTSSKLKTCQLFLSNFLIQKQLLILDAVTQMSEDTVLHQLRASYKAAQQDTQRAGLIRVHVQNPKPRISDYIQAQLIPCVSITFILKVPSGIHLSQLNFILKGLLLMARALRSIHKGKKEQQANTCPSCRAPGQVPGCTPKLRGSEVTSRDLQTRCPSLLPELQSLLDSSDKIPLNPALTCDRYNFLLILTWTKKLSPSPTS